MTVDLLCVTIKQQVTQAVELNRGIQRMTTMMFPLHEFWWIYAPPPAPLSLGSVYTTRIHGCRPLTRPVDTAREHG